MTQQQVAKTTRIKCDALSRIECNAIQPSFSIDHKARQDPLGVKSGKHVDRDFARSPAGPFFFTSRP